jgi:hypothetical protein
MENHFSEGLLKKTITYLVFICRLLTLVIFYFIYAGGMLTDIELPPLLYIVLPMSALYLVFIIKYAMITNRYFAEGEPVTRRHFHRAYLPFIFLHTMEVLMVYFKNLLFGDSNFLTLCGLVTLLECLLAVYAGFYLSDLFGADTQSNSRYN